MISFRNRMRKRPFPKNPWRKPAALLRRGGGSSSGQALVEFALTIPLVLFLFFGVYEFGRFYYTRLTLQHSVSEAARFAVTGSVLPDSLGNRMSRANSIIAVINLNAKNLDVDVDRVTINPSDGGGPGDVVSINAEFSFQFMIPGYTLMFPDGQLDFEVSTTMKNEPFIQGTGGSTMFPRLIGGLRSVRRFLRCQKGQALVETALVAPILLMIVLGLIESGTGWPLSTRWPC